MYSLCSQCTRLVTLTLLLTALVSVETNNISMNQMCGSRRSDNNVQSPLVAHPPARFVGLETSSGSWRLPAW
jgi:hypothetical protein